MTTEITTREAEAPPITMALARALSEATWLAAPMRGKPADVLMAMLTGRELGIGPMAALRLIYVVEGRPTLSATLQLALLRRAGHRITEDSASGERAQMTGRHALTGDVITVDYTLAEAQAAGLVKPGSAWAKYPKDMLYARCASRLARRLDSTAVAGMIYTAQDFIDAAPAEVVNAQNTPDVEPDTEDDPGDEGVALPPDAEPGEAPWTRLTVSDALRESLPASCRPSAAALKPLGVEGGWAAVFDHLLALHASDHGDGCAHVTEAMMVVVDAAREKMA